jgi:hypothetical protein
VGMPAVVDLGRDARVGAGARHGRAGLEPIRPR